MSLGGPEILVIVVLALLVFGPTRLPEIGRQIGRAVRELRKIEHQVKSEIRSVIDVDEPEGSGAPQYGDPTNVPEAPDAVEPSEPVETVEGINDSEPRDHEARETP
jgi:sec-independent protein translocase protein TatA